METLHELESPLLRTVPQRDVKSSSNGNRNMTGNAAIANTDLSSLPERETQLPLLTTHSADEECITRRFSHKFSDPAFPQKSVPFAFFKRSFDILFASVFLILMSPIMILIALAIKLTSKGPVVFKQIRVGQGGRYFWCYKFRSMCVDAEAKKHELMHLNEASGPVFKIKCDPRITPIGAFIRKFSLDEFPQFFNVLKGDMSIVGPRPPLPMEVSAYSAHERKRLAVRPGLTCLWQVSGRSNISFQHWVELDILYIDTMTFGNDIKIVLRTIPAVLVGSGAH